MTKMYRAWCDTCIEEVEVLKETEKFVIVQDRYGVRREAKRSTDHMNYFTTWQDARDFLIDRENSKIAQHLREIDRHREVLNEIKEMVQP